jgi:TonB family protein
VRGDSELVAAIPFGGLLVHVWRVLLAADRRDEFVGDLIEQANGELADRPPGEVGRWLWQQTLSSAPWLLALRVRQFLRRANRWAARAAAPAGVPLSLMGWQSERRSWPVPVAISVSLHAVGIAVLAAMTLGQIEQLDAPWVPVALKRAFAATHVVAVAPAVAPVAPVRRHKPRTTRPAMAELPAPPIQDEIPFEDPVERKLVIIDEPPPVADKRCIFCPAPTLPPAFVRLGSSQQVVVKTCVGSKGDVTSVDVVRGLGALADARVIDTVRSWRFSPHAVGDHPVPFCYPTRFVFTMN